RSEIRAGGPEPLGGEMLLIAGHFTRPDLPPHQRALVVRRGTVTHNEQPLCKLAAGVAQWSGCCKRLKCHGLATQPQTIEQYRSATPDRISCGKSQPRKRLQPFSPESGD